VCVALLRLAITKKDMTAWKVDAVILGGVYAERTNAMILRSQNAVQVGAFPGLASWTTLAVKRVRLAAT
jgi:hypothetical protein